MPLRLGGRTDMAMQPVRSSTMANGAEPARPHPAVAPRWLKDLWAAHPLVVACGIAVLALAITIGLLWPLTDVIAAHDVGLLTGPKRAPALQAAREAVRTQLLTLGAGIFAGGALLFTGRNFLLSREGQVTDRYTKAIEQVGANALDVRIGGIYALQRVARDSARDHQTVMAVLTAFIREHSREPWPASESVTDPPEYVTRPDVQAAVTVVSHRDPANDRGRIDLRRAGLAGADLTGARMAGANLSSADLSQADLTGADLTGADLSQANLTGADLTGATLSQADLTEANLSEANLTGATLADAILERAHLTGSTLDEADFNHAKLAGADLSAARFTNTSLPWANLKDAVLTNATLTGANFTGAKLTWADFTHANLTGAEFPEGQPEPYGWVRAPETGLLRPARRA
jgi:uncharacterized protein YjbI with pentapeptide repeats